LAGVQVTGPGRAAGNGAPDQAARAPGARLCAPGRHEGSRAGQATGENVEIGRDDSGVRGMAVEQHVRDRRSKGVVVRLFIRSAGAMRGEAIIP